MATDTTSVQFPIRVLLLVTIVIGVAAAWDTAPARAATICDGAIGAHIIRESVTVPAGAFCGLIGTQVRGNVTVGPGAQVSINEAQIRGSFIATGDADAILIQATEIRANLDLSAGSGSRTNITGSWVRGSVTLTDVIQDEVRLELTTVTGSVTVTGNSVSTLTIRSNTIGGFLHCADNTPAPIAADNIAGDVITGQCVTT